MPPEPRDTTDPTHPEVALAYEEELATYSRLLRAMARRVGRDRRLRIAVMREYTEIRAALARLASAVGLPGAGVDEIEAAITKLRSEAWVRRVGPSWLHESNDMCVGAERELTELRAENERLRAELAEAHDALALALRSGVWKVGPEIAARIHSIKEALGRPAGVAAPEPLAEARDTGTDRPTIAERARAMGIRPHEPEEAFGVSAAPASPVPPAPDEGLTDARMRLLDAARARLPRRLTPETIDWAQFSQDVSWIREALNEYWVEHPLPDRDEHLARLQDVLGFCVQSAYLRQGADPSPVPPAPDEARDVLRELAALCDEAEQRAPVVHGGGRMTAILTVPQVRAVLAEAADDHE